MDETQSQLLVNEARKEIENGNNPVAKNILVNLLKQDKNVLDAWLLLSEILDNPDQRIKSLNNVLRINPNHSIARRRLSEIKEIQNRPEPIQPQPSPTIANYPKISRNPWPFRILLLALIGLVCLCSIFFLPGVLGVLGTLDTEETGATVIRAGIMCELAVKNQLVAPSTAKFAPNYQRQIWTLGKASGVEDAWRIKSYVDAQNGFGAMVRTYFTCDIKYDGGEWAQLSNWTVALDFDE